MNSCNKDKIDWNQIRSSDFEHSTNESEPVILIAHLWDMNNAHFSTIVFSSILPLVFVLMLMLINNHAAALRIQVHKPLR